MFVLLAGLLLNGASASYEVLAAEDACFHGLTINTNTFNAPQDGLIEGIRLVHKSGGVTCGGSTLYNWGCYGGLHGVFLLRDDDSNILYPRFGGTLNTEDVTETGHPCTTPCGTGADSWWTFTSGPGTSTSNEAEITLLEPAWTVSTTETYRLVFGEPCCQWAVGDNSGTSCADVYFIYAQTPCEAKGDGLNHDCQCQESCGADDVDQFCKPMNFVAGVLGETQEADDVLCPQGGACCCSCPPCKNYTTPQ